MADKDDNKGYREVPVDWEALEDAFENNAPEVHSYLHLESGEVLRIVDGIADPEMHSRILNDSTYLRVEPVSSREQYRWMERFIQMLDDSSLKQRLTNAIDGKGAFRRFKDVLMSHAPERERWFAFRSERLRVFMEAWLTAHKLVAVAREEVRATAAPADSPPISQDQVGPKRSRSPEWMRRQLSEIAESLGSRDLDKILTFAEFVKARRVARGYVQRAESPSDVAHPPPEESSPARDDDDGEPESSRKVSAAH